MSSSLKQPKTKVGKIAAPGRIGNLTHKEEIALKSVWAILLKSCGYEVKFPFADLEKGRPFTSSIIRKSVQETASIRTPKAETEHLSISSSSTYDSPDTCSRVRTVFYSLETGMYDDSDAFSFCETPSHPWLEGYVVEDLHRSLWEACRLESPDNFLLWYLRRCDFEVKSAVKMIVSALDWRINEAMVEKVLCNGDSAFYFDGSAPKLVQAFMRNEIFLRGRARDGSPLVYIRAKMHLRANCPDADFEKFILLLFEWVRLKFHDRKGVDRCQVVFDLTGFSMKNADYHAVKFFVRTFQKRYPDLCARLYVHNAPTVFSIMWKVIQPWLKPYVREMVMFTQDYEHLHQHISAQYLPKSVGGTANEVPAYVEPNHHNCQRKLPDENFDTLQKQRDHVTVQYIDTTVRWLEASTPAESRALRKRKVLLARERAQNYAALDPYLRARGIPDRNGEIGTLSS